MSRSGQFLDNFWTMGFGYVENTFKAAEISAKLEAVWTKDKPVELIDQALEQLRIAVYEAPWVELDGYQKFESLNQKN